MKLLCPVCRNNLNITEHSYICSNKHNFDLSKEGYINLYLKKSSNSGDEKEMVKARTLFLNKDYYLFLKEKLNEFIKSKDGSLVDLACGEGYYTSYFEVQDKIGIDLSKEALKVASKRDKSTTYVLSSIFETPLLDKCADTVLTCFAPIAKDEIKRILKDDGQFILVRPDINHLFELKEIVYDNPYKNDDVSIELDGFACVHEYHLQDKATLNNDDLKNLFKMTPYYHTTSIKDKEKLNSINELSVTFGFIIDIYTKK